MYIRLTWSFPGMDSFTIFISLNISFSSGSHSINHSPPLLAVSGGYPSPHLLLFLFLLSSSGIFLLSVSQNVPWISRLLLLFLLLPCVISFPAFSGLRTLFLYFPSHVARCKALLNNLHPPLLFLFSQTLPQSVPCCSHLFSYLPNFFLYFPNSSSSSLCCSGPSLSPACYFLLHLHCWFNPLFNWTMALCCSLPNRILPLLHMLVYYLSSPVG